MPVHATSLSIVCTLASLVRGGANPLCEPPLSVPLENGEVRRFENGSLLHDGVTYPRGMHWTDNETTFGCICALRLCLRKCCQDDEFLNDESHVACEKMRDGALARELRLGRDQLAPEIRNVSIRERFATVRNVDCPGKRYELEPENYPEDRFVLLPNGSLLTGEGVLRQWEYCMDWDGSVEKIRVLKCIELMELPVMPINTDTIYHVGMIVSVPFLLATFLVYAIIPELRNLYGKTLMCYVLCLISAYCFLVLAGLRYFAPTLCIIMAFVIHFSFLASFFWLNVMCFDIWWTFGGFRSLQGSIKQRERKKFIIYSIYAWGSASILTGICIIMDFVPTVPKSFIRPEFGAQSCWFTTDEAKAIYFYGPMGVTVICNICLFISTALKIIRHKRDTAHHLRGSESKRHDDNKQWFNLYLKLFIVMGINWSMEIVSWLCKGTPQYVWYITDLANTLQGLIIFIIFVWKDKIKRLLLKRFGCHDQSVLSRNSTRSAYQSSTTRTGMTSATPLQEKVNPYVQDGSYRNKITTDESDFS